MHFGVFSTIRRAIFCFCATESFLSACPVAVHAATSQEPCRHFKVPRCLEMVDVAPIVFDDDWEEWTAEKGSFVDHMTAGSIAGVAEHLIMFPVDTYKVCCCDSS